MQRKPHEQTWHVDESGTLIRDERDYRIAETIEIDIPPQERDNAKLIAQAPAMARLLLTLAYDSEDGCCLRCDRGSTMPHEAECSIGAVLKAAGVLET